MGPAAARSLASRISSIFSRFHRPRPLPPACRRYCVPYYTKIVCGNLYCDPGRIAGHPAAGYRPHGTLPLVRCGGEGLKVLSADQTGSRLLHGHQYPVVRIMPALMDLEYRPDRIGVNRILIHLAGCAADASKESGTSSAPAITMSSGRRLFRAFWRLAVGTGSRSGQRGPPARRHARLRPFGTSRRFRSAGRRVSQTPPEMAP